MSDPAPSLSEGPSAGSVSRGKRPVLLLAFLGALLVTSFFPGRREVIDLKTHQAIPGARVEPIDPVLQTLTEPFYGPLHAFSRLPLMRMLSVLLWIAGIVFARRLWIAVRQGGGPRRIACEVGFLIGAYAPLALLPAIAYWSNLVTKRAMTRLTPVGVPLAVFVLTLAIVLLRPSSRGRRFRLFLATSRAFLGIAGMSVACLLILIYALRGSVYTAGERLVAPDSAYLVDLHEHGQEGDGLVDGPTRLDLFHRLGFSITAVTEHNYFDTYEDDMPYRRLRTIVQEKPLGMAVVPGEEFTTHALHLILLGTHRWYRPSEYRLPDFERLQTCAPTYGYDLERLIREVHREGGYVVVAHWWMIWTWYKVDWRHLVDLGVDGFEVSNAADWAPRSLIDAWKERGLRLFAGTDFHGWHKSVYTWNLIDRASINPEGKPLAELDPDELVRRIFQRGVITPAVLDTHNPDWPVALDPPVQLWRYLVGLRLPNRCMWGAVALVLWGVARAVRRRPRRADDAAPLVPSRKVPAFAPLEPPRSVEVSRLKDNEGHSQDLR
ncbi:MAG TPA: hypothetical protein VEN81_05255 [Planctomycetota bacterium]|nr:hypothetical protein [Planctomycetota bacterium]